MQLESSHLHHSGPPRLHGMHAADPLILCSSRAVNCPCNHQQLHTECFLTWIEVVKGEVGHISLLLLRVAAISGLPRGLLCLGLGICGRGCLALHWGKPAPAGLAQACWVLVSGASQAVCMPAPLRMQLLALVLQHGS